MNNSTKTKIRKKFQEEDNKMSNLINLGNSMMNQKSFDIKNYLNLYEQIKPKNKKAINIYNSRSQYSQYSTFNTKYHPLNFGSEGCISSTNYKTSSMDKNFNKGIKGKNMLNIMTSTYNEYKDNIMKETTSYKNIYTKSSNNFSYNKNRFSQKYSPAQTKETGFNVIKAVKEIKKSFQFPKIINNKIQNKNIINRNKYPSNKVSYPIAFKEKYLSTIFDPAQVINNYNNRKDLELENENDLKSFPIKTKNITLNNVLIDLLNNETIKISEKEKQLKTKNEKNEKILLTELKKFEEFTEKQKQVCKNLETHQENIQKQNEILIQELVTYRLNKKAFTDETQKILEQIESLRNYALFVSKALELDSKRYEKSIFPDYKEEKIDEYDKNMEKIKSNVINNYRVFWDKNYKDQLKNELISLNNTDSLFFKFDELEGNIMRYLEEEFYIHKEMERDKKYDKEVLKYLQERYDNTLDEYNSYEEKLNFEMNHMKGLNNKENKLNKEYIELIGELFLEIFNVFGRFDKKKFDTNILMKEKINKDNVDNFLREGNRILRETEDYLNSKLLEIKSYRENDSIFFNKFMNNMKKKMKEEQLIQFKKNKMTNLMGKNKQIIIKANKVPFISRKTEAPYHSPKKKSKIVINHGLIKKVEDDELLNYQ